ncbi:hypothetical protein HanIR_Chr12g0574051 [Helianthus annuus]|nr:hypothetical protein HanIR_Chr12g0574051 [Helianthus annuus]
MTVRNPYLRRVCVCSSEFKRLWSIQSVQREEGLAKMNLLN